MIDAWTSVVRGRPSLNEQPIKVVIVLFVLPRAQPVLEGTRTKRRAGLGRDYDVINGNAGADLVEIARSLELELRMEI